MTETFNIYEAKTNLSKLIERVKAGETIVIAKGGVPQAQLIPLTTTQQENPKRVPGLGKGKIWMSDDCWNPMTEEELKEWYGGELPLLEKQDIKK